MNSERQAVELDVRTAAEEQVSQLRGLAVSESRHLETSQPRDRETPRVLVLAGENWHKGVIGLAAGRIAQKYHRPTLVMSIDGETAVGSARSIPTIDLHAQLESVSDVFTHFGGHVRPS
jgi:single-stranded-DNA-specific exonuclease